MAVSSALWRKLQPRSSLPSITHHRLLPRSPSLHHQQASARLITRQLPSPQPQVGALNRRPFMSLSARHAPQECKPQSISSKHWEELSPETQIQECGGKWGWVIYRCSYAKEFDSGWDDLKRHIQGMRESIINESDAPSVAETMDFIFVEDPALEGASIEELQHRFQAWAREDTAGIFDVDSGLGSRGSRYEFFLRVDDEGLRNGYVGLVQGWPCDPGWDDWMKISVGGISTWVYMLLDNPEMWYPYYKPPEFGVWEGW